MRCREKVPYGCEQQALNAAWLHEAAYPDCAGVEPYQCRDCSEWHIEHETKAGGLACKLTPRPVLHRPKHQHRRRVAS